MMELMEIMPLVLYFLGAVVLTLLAILLYRVIKTMEIVDLIVRDTYQKSQKLNGLFDLTEKVELLNDRVINAIVNGIMKLFSRKKEGDDIDG